MDVLPGGITVRGLGHRSGHRARARSIRQTSPPTESAHLQALPICARQDSNLRPLAPEASALSTELRAQTTSWGRHPGLAAYRRHTRGVLCSRTPSPRMRFRVATVAPMDLSLFFLGTAGSVPSARRGLPAVLVRRGGDRLLFDCGEGTQRQLLRSVGLLDLDSVFITHFHADHWLGLPGMLKSFALRERSEPLSVYGPPGLKQLLGEMRVVFGRLPYPCEIVEL